MLSLHDALPILHVSGLLHSVSLGSPQVGVAALNPLSVQLPLPLQEPALVQAPSASLQAAPAAASWLTQLPSVPLQVRSEEHTSELQSRLPFVRPAFDAFPTRRSSDLARIGVVALRVARVTAGRRRRLEPVVGTAAAAVAGARVGAGALGVAAGRTCSRDVVDAAAVRAAAGEIGRAHV